MRLHPPLPPATQIERKDRRMPSPSKSPTQWHSSPLAYRATVESYRQLCFHRDIRETNEIRSRGCSARPPKPRPTSQSDFRESQYRTAGERAVDHIHVVERRLIARRQLRCMRNRRAVSRADVHVAVRSNRIVCRATRVSRRQFRPMRPRLRGGRTALSAGCDRTNASYQLQTARRRFAGASAMDVGRQLRAGRKRAEADGVALVRAPRARTPLVAFRGSARRSASSVERASPARFVTA
jgi:hypothetical protein